MGIWRGVLVVGLVCGLTLISAQFAQACSCAALDPREHLDLADAAFVGTLISREEPSSGPVYSGGEEVTWTFQVERAVKGDLGDVIEVQSPIDGAACGFGIAVGQRVGVFLFENGGQWHGGSCGVIDADALLRAIEAPPAPDGSGPVALLLANDTGDARVMALDSDGQTLAYGMGDGEVRDFSVCPGVERVVELVAHQDGRRELAVRDLRSFEVVSEVELRDDSSGTSSVLSALTCRDPSGGDVLVYDVYYVRFPVSSRFLRVQDGEMSTLYETQMEGEGGHQATFEADGDVAYITKGHRGHEIAVIDLATGAELSVFPVPAIEGEPDYMISLALSPDGTKLAALGYQPGPVAKFRLIIIDLSMEPVAMRELSLGESPLYSSVTWLDNLTFLVSGGDHYPDGSPVYDLSLSHVSSMPGWSAQEPLLLDDTLYGLGGYGSLYSAPLPDGPVTTLQTFDNPNLYVLAVVPGEVEIDPQPAPATEEPDKVSIDDEEVATAPAGNDSAVVAQAPTPDTGVSDMTGDYDFDTSTEADDGPTRSVEWWFIGGLLAFVGVVGGGWAVYQRWVGSR